MSDYQVQGDGIHIADQHGELVAEASAPALGDENRDLLPWQRQAQEQMPSRGTPTGDERGTARPPTGVTQEMVFMAVSQALVENGHDTFTSGDFVLLVEAITTKIMEKVNGQG